MAAYQSTEPDVQGVLMQEIPGARVVQHFQGDQDVELAKGTLRVLMVSVAIHSPFSDPSAASTNEKSPIGKESTDIWLALEVGSTFSLPVKASQSVIPERQSSSYLFPSSDVPGASIKLVFDSRDAKSMEQFEELLVDYCAFQSDSKGKGTLELLDDQGQLLGTIDGPWQLNEDAALHKPGHEKDPVMLELPGDSASGISGHHQIGVSSVPREQDGSLSASYQNDWLLKGAHLVSRTLETGSSWVGTRLLSAADSYVKKNTPPSSQRASFDDGSRQSGEKALMSKGESDALSSANASSNASTYSSGSTRTTSGREAVTFSPQVHGTANNIKKVSGTVVHVSSRTTSAIMSVASNVGDQIGKRTGIQQRAQTDGTVQQPKGVRGALNRSLIAFNVVLDGVTNSAERLLKDGGEASGRVIEHRYGSEAKVISGNVASVGRSAFVVYKDINGVRRKALLKVATGTIKARAPDGSEVVLQHGADTTQGASLQQAPPANDPPAYNPYTTSSTTVTEKR